METPQIIVFTKLQILKGSSIIIPLTPSFFYEKAHNCLCFYHKYYIIKDKTINDIIILSY